MSKRKIIFTSRLREGGEQQVMQDLRAIFPADALNRIEGLEKVTICQGNGMFAAIVEFDGDFEKIYAEYISNPAVHVFHSKMAEILEDVPTSTKPAELPIVGDVLYWDGKKVREAIG